MKADFKSLRGDFKFNSNHYPIQNFYLVKVAKRPDGKYQTEIVQKVFGDYCRSVRRRLPDEVSPSFACGIAHLSPPAGRGRIAKRSG